jgi:serine/threonine protein kinase/tetratricopeptide (TPR) repeat protein
MSEPTRTHLPDAAPATLTRADDGASTDAREVAAPPGYEFLAEIGRGGMGVIYRARDLDLGREVAVKVLLPQFAPDSPTARRFVDEARITGRLQHPGIPPIYRVGAGPDGRPFLAMKLIDGRTLEEFLKRREEPADAEPAAGFGLHAGAMFDRLEALLERGRLLAIFEQVAQAVAYAHQQGVIHRDLKPANVMVGAFGEVQVMDWGIARSGDRRPDAVPGPDGEPGATVEFTPGLDYRTPQSDLTQAGAILGTPAFMPPEQAIGAVDQVGKHSDVFGLGAILCVILTGKPPYAGADAESNRRLAARAQLGDAFARLDACGAEPELVALAKRCLAPEPADRPRDAGEVAVAVATLRADAERRARQAEMDRARAEVKTAEERKRRRVQYALALSVLGLLAFTGFAAWWADGVRAQRRAEQITRESELTARQLTTERDVAAALNEAQLLREEGWKQADDPSRWALALSSARSALTRADVRLAEGPSEELRTRVAAEPSGVAALQRWSAVTAELHDRVAAARAELDRDDRDRALLLALDRAADGNEIRLLLSVSFTDLTSRQFAAAFREHGIDLLAVPTEEAVAWLRGHRLRGRLVTAVRTWQQSLPAWDPGVPFGGALMEDLLTSAVAASAAVAGTPAIAALGPDRERQLEKLRYKTGTSARLGAILKAVTDHPFQKEWWDAVARRDNKTLRKLVRNPEIGRLSSRELSSLADGLNPFAGTSDPLKDLLRDALERFPGEFWVHFRLAFQSQFDDVLPGPDTPGSPETVRHLTAAIAIRPNSGIARAAMGMELIERTKDEAEGLRWLRSASTVEPTSPWPHLFIGMYAIEKGDWSDGFRALKDAVRVDPDTGYFMTGAAGLLMLTGAASETNRPGDDDMLRFVNELAAVHPKHHGAHSLLGKYHLDAGDHRAALAHFRKAKSLWPEYAGLPVIGVQIGELESKARWEAKFPAVLRGELTPATPAEAAELADFCATFEKRFAMATRIAAGAVEADPQILHDGGRVAKFAGWAVQAAAGKGVDGPGLPLLVRDRYRRLALEWVLALQKKSEKTGYAAAFLLAINRDLAPVRDEKELAKLPAAERAEWEKFWAATEPVFETPRSRKREPAPPPRVRPDTNPEPDDPPAPRVPPPRPTSP